MIYTKQRCKKCNQLKVVTEFPPTKLVGGVQKYGTTCTVCLQETAKVKEVKSTKPANILEDLENIDENVGFRVCKECGERKPLTEYFKDRISNGIQRYRGECKKCAIEASKARTKKYRANKSYVTQDLTVSQWKETCEFFDNTCVYCGGPVEEQEHLVAVSQGGGYTQSNIVPACKRCNTSKGNRSLAQWYIEVPWFSKERLSKIVEYIKIYGGMDDEQTRGNDTETDGIRD